MAMQAVRLLQELVADGTLSFDESDLKGERNSAKRRLLYSLGAYKGTVIDEHMRTMFGLKPCKKMIALGINISIENYLDFFLFDEAQSFYKVLDVKILSLLRSNSSHYWRVGQSLKDLKTWKGIKRGKDLFIAGLGGFNINSAFRSIDIGRYDTGIVSITTLRCKGYFPEEPNTYYLESLYKHSIELFKWVYINKFPISRIDELKDLEILGFYNPKLSLRDVLSRLDDVIDRDLRLSWSDKYDFDYPERVKQFANTHGFTVPKNGIELKKQAKVFQNCSGGYVKRIQDKNCFIVYNADEMIEINRRGDTILQHLGKRNARVDEVRRVHLEENLRRAA